MNMKKLVLAVAMSSAMAMGAAHATDQGHGTVTFKGSIIDAPCSISPDTIDQTVDLGQISNKALQGGGSSTPRSFSIKLEQCDTATLKSVTTTFTGSPSSADSDLLAIKGSASGASIVLTDNGNTPIKLGAPSSAVSLHDGNNTLQFAAFLKGDGASATIVPGEFTSVANFALTYQ